ncbi:MAG: AI-2E family transporter [Candidatus Velthaea sp.]
MKARLVRRTLIALAAVVLIAVLGVFFAHIPRTVTVFLIAAFIAFGATPLVRRLESRMPRAAAIGIVYLALLGALVVIALVVIPVTYAQMASLLFHAPDYVNASQELVARAVRALQARFGNRIILPSVADLQAEVGGRVAGVLSTALDSVGAFVVGTVNVLFIGVSALILSIFFVSRSPLFGHSLLEFVPPGKREETKRLFDEIASIFGHFIAGQAFLCAIVGVIVWVALLPLHFSFSLLVAVICGLGYAVPFVGMIVAQVLAAVLAIPQGGAMVASVTVEIFVISRVADNLLVPKVMSQSVGVSPIGVMFAVFAGGELFGVPGLLLGIPAAAMVKVLFKFFVQPYILRMQLSDTGAADVPGLVADGDAKEVDVEIVVADASERAPDAQPSVVVGIRS